MKKSTHFINGKFVTEKELKISPRDLGFARGYAVFDFLITYHGKPFMLSKHIDRLFRSASLIGFKLPWSKSQVSRWVLKTLEKNKGNYEKAIKIIASGGLSNGMLPNGSPSIIIIIDPLHKFPEHFYEKGVKVITAKHTRYDPQAKTNNYIEGVKQSQIGAKKGAFVPVYYDDSQVFEGSNNNIFAVIGNELITPKSNILLGLTREILLKKLKLNIPIKIKDFKLKDLMKAEEVFLTGSLSEIMPVVKIDTKKVGNGKVGPITKEVMKQFADFTKND